MIVPFRYPDCIGYSVQYTYEELMYKADLLISAAAKVDDELRAVYMRQAEELVQKARNLPVGES